MVDFRVHGHIIIIQVSVIFYTKVGGIFFVTVEVETVACQLLHARVCNVACLYFLLIPVLVQLSINVLFAKNENLYFNMLKYVFT